MVNSFRIRSEKSIERYLYFLECMKREGKYTAIKKIAKKCHVFIVMKPTLMKLGYINEAREWIGPEKITRDMAIKLLDGIRDYQNEIRFRNAS